MSEEQAKYITDANEMVGAGYEHPERPRHGFESPNFTQVPNDLFLKMGGMDECELKVVMYICRYTFGYHRDSVKISIRKMAIAIGMNTASVAKGAAAAERRGLIRRVIDGLNTTEWRAIVTDAVSEIESPVYQKLNHPVSEIESQVGLNKDKERVKDNTTTRANSSEVFRAYEAEIGLITPRIADAIGDYLDELSISPEWMIDAFHIAAEQNKRNWAYCAAILKRWAVEGKTALPPKQRPSGPKYPAKGDNTEFFKNLAKSAKENNAWLPEKKLLNSSVI